MINGFVVRKIAELHLTGFGIFVGQLTTYKNNNTWAIFNGFKITFLKTNVDKFLVKEAMTD